MTRMTRHTRNGSMRRRLLLRHNQLHCFHGTTSTTMLRGPTGVHQRWIERHNGSRRSAIVDQHSGPRPAGAAGPGPRLGAAEGLVRILAGTTDRSRSFAAATWCLGAWFVPVAPRCLGAWFVPAAPRCLRLLPLTAATRLDHLDSFAGLTLQGFQFLRRQVDLADHFLRFLRRLENLLRLVGCLARRRCHRSWSLILDRFLRIGSLLLGLRCVTLFLCCFGLERIVGDGTIHTSSRRSLRTLVSATRRLRPLLGVFRLLVRRQSLLGRRILRLHVVSGVHRLATVGQ